jgi:hypothetical protein
MTKEQLIEWANGLADGEIIAMGGLWVKFDVEEWDERDLTAEEWERFVYWFEKYQDSSNDYNDALAYARGKI